MCKFSLKPFFITAFVFSGSALLPSAHAAANIRYELYTPLVYAVSAMQLIEQETDDLEEEPEDDVDDDDEAQLDTETPAALDADDDVVEDNDDAVVEELTDIEDMSDDLSGEDFVEDDPTEAEEIEVDDINDDDDEDDDFEIDELDNDDDFDDDDDDDDDLEIDDMGDSVEQFSDDDDVLSDDEPASDSGVVDQDDDEASAPHEKIEQKTNEKKISNNKNNSRSGGGGSYSGPNTFNNPTNSLTGKIKTGYRPGDDEELDDAGFLSRAGELLAINMDESMVDLVKASGFTVTRSHNLSALGLSVINLRLPDNMKITEALSSLKRDDPDTIYVYNHLYDLANTNTSKELNRTASQSLSTHFHSFKSSIGIIDTKIDANHSALSSITIKHHNFSQHEHAPIKHGTAIASRLVANQKSQAPGLLPNATLYAANVFYQSKTGSINATAESLASALDWMVKNNVKVINMSLAGPPNDLLRLAIENTIVQGHFIIAAAGNEGPAAPPAYPAAYPDVIAVTAVDQQERVYRRANRGQHIDFSAFGVSVMAAAPDNSYANYTGTSFASPVVAAIISVLSEHSSLKKPPHLLNILQRSAKDIGKKGFDPVFGHGLLTTDITVNDLP